MSENQRGRRYNRTKKTQGGDRKSEESKDQNDTLISTAAKLGTQHGVNSRHRASQYGQLSKRLFNGSELAGRARGMAE